MKHFNKSLLLILVLISIFMFTGCKNISFKTYKGSDDLEYNIEDNNSEKEEELPNNKEHDNNKENEEEIGDPSDVKEEDPTDKDQPTPTIIQPVDNTELLIYIVNSLAELEAVPALVPADSEITPQLIVDTVVDSMADRSLIIGIESVTTKDDAVIVSFYADKPPLNNVGSGLEDAILNAIAQSLTDNLDKYNKVIYRVEGGPYSSGHIELGIDEVYFED